MSELVQNNKSGERIFVYDALRFIAIAAVIMIHCSAAFVAYFYPHNIKFVTGNIFDSISRIGVPLFLMLSGVFMLDENRSLPYKKLAYKIGKLLLLLIFWAAVYAIIFHQKELIYYFFYGHVHLWYLYVIIGLYLVTPILRLFVKSENKAILYYFVVLALIFQFLPDFISFCCHRTNYVSKFFDMFKVYSVCGYVAYYILGRLIAIDFDRIIKYKNLILYLGIIAVIASFTGAELYTTKTAQTYRVFFEEKNILVFIYSISSFVLLTNIIKNNEHKFSGCLKQAITSVSKLSFGIYLVHMIILSCLQANILKDIFSITIKNTNAFLYIVITYLITFVLSYVVVFIMSKIKYINQLVKI